jgi:hypothetical protein
MQWFFGENDEDHAAAVFFNITGAEYVKEKIDFKFHFEHSPLTPDKSVSKFDKLFNP